MKLKNSTWILLMVAIVSGTGVYIHENHIKPLQAARQEQEKRLFSFAVEDIQTLTIDRNGTTLSFQRTGDSNTPWRMTRPEKSSASDASLSFLTGLLVDGRIDRTFSVSHSQKSEYGLDNPQGTLKVTLENGRTHTLILGKTDYEDKFLYAQIDPVENSGQIGVSLVDKSFQYGIDRPLSEWKGL